MEGVRFYVTAIAFGAAQGVILLAAALGKPYLTVQMLGIMGIAYLLRPQLEEPK